MSKWVSEPVMRPFCAKCATLLRLSRLDFDAKGYEHRTYRCQSCGKTESTSTQARRVGGKPSGRDGDDGENSAKTV